MKVTRRKFVAGAGSLAFAGLTNYLSGCSYDAKSKSIPAYGPLVEARDAILDLPEGCRFQNRCPHQKDECLAAAPEMQIAEPGHEVSCVRWKAL